MGATETRVCTHCHLTLPDSDFYLYHTDSRDGKRVQPCKACRQKQTTQWNRNHPDRVREDRWRCQGIFGADGSPLTFGEYAAVLAFQGNRCALCGGEFVVQSAHADHPHTEPGTGSVWRGALCGVCNQQAVGRYEKTGHYKGPVIEARIAAYLANPPVARWLLSSRKPTERE